MRDELAVERRYSISEASKLIGVARSTIQGWKSRKYYQPSITDMETGQKYFSFRDLVLLEATRILRVNRTHSIQRLRKYVPRFMELFEKMGDKMEEFSILVFGDQLMAYTGDATIYGPKEDPDMHLCIAGLRDRVQNQLLFGTAPREKLPGDLVWIDGNPVRT
ncbi:unnamed protein product [marine sediment metagenome]|uniref:HTH merR-type domain-containing protein n=1 Tax=marine sediment metagenome TaxID=412755 RepID=X0ZM51_9ZZZZ